MAGPVRHLDRERAASAGFAGVVHALLLYALIAGLGSAAPLAEEEGLRLFDLAEAPPPPRIEEEAPAADQAAGPEAEAEDAPEEAPAPPNLRAEPTPVVAPPPAVRLPVPSPVAAAPVAGTGAAASAGATDVVGPGTGAGGVGTGRGGGGRGGEGGGGGGGAAVTRAWKLSGALMPLRLPARAYRQGADVTFRIAVGPDGRVTGCRVERMTGAAEIGAAEIGAAGCRAIAERYRYRPARDAEGRATSDVLFENHAWGEVGK